MAVSDPATAPAGRIVAGRDCGTRGCGTGDGIGVWGASGGTRSIDSCENDDAGGGTRGGGPSKGSCASGDEAGRLRQRRSGLGRGSVRRRTRGRCGEGEGSRSR